MANPADKAKRFFELHVKGDPVVLFNIWDPGTAAIVAGAGAAAIATGSKPVASAFGYDDGEKIPLALALDNVRRIVSAVDLPVTMDLEGGYGVDGATIAATFEQAVAAGAIGFNFEDQVVGGSGLHPLAEQVKRVAAARRGADSAGFRTFLNARTDIFLKAPREEHDKAKLDQAIERAKAYADAGADGFFAPGLADPALIAALCAATPLPVNIIALPGVPPKAELAKAGVARISYGPVPWRRMAAWLEAEAKAALD